MIRGTFFTSLREPVGSPFACTRQKLVDRFQRPRAFPTKDAAPRWAPVQFRGHHRRLANVERAHAVVLDVDDGASQEKVTDAFGRWSGFMHTTWSSTPDAPRWRVVLWPTRTMTADEYGRVHRAVRIVAERAGVVVDGAAADASRCWSLPACAPGREHEYRLVILGGAALDVARALAFVPANEPLPEPVSMVRDESYESRLVRAERWLAAVPGAISGSGGHAQTFRAAVGLVRGFGLAEGDAFRLMLEQYNDRCQPRWLPRELKYKIKSALMRSTRAAGFLADAPRKAS